MDDLINEFLTETNESLNELDLDLVKLEQNPNDQDLLSKIFRVIHTIKGTCGFLSLPRLESVAHKGEDVLGLFRDGTLEVTEDYVTLIFESLDRIKYIIGEIEATGSEPEGDDDELKKKLEDVYNSAGNSGIASEDELQALWDATEVEGVDAVSEKEEGEKAEEVSTPEIVQEAPSLDEVEAKAEALAGKSKEKDAADTQSQAKRPSVAAQSLRVNVDVLEDLMTMVSELVLTRNQLLQILRMQAESDFTTPLQRLNHVVSELQEGVMKTRMQPIGNAWAKLPRIIRDISLELGKKIDLEMKGQDTELDRQVLELIKDPLTHMVRNSADHGIETPEERMALGKPESGKIKLNSYHEGGHIIIEISDDGRGLSVEKIKAKVLSNGLATEEELEEMTTQQVNQFIFKAGFSTAEKVTSVSGRGVGMDVVRSNIEKIGGSIELNSEEGKGSRFLIKIPLTLAIVSALIVESMGEKFAIPQLAVKELVMVSEKGENRIENIKGAPVFRLRDHLLPLVPLNELLGLQATAPEILDVVAEDNVVSMPVKDITDEVDDEASEAEATSELFQDEEVAEEKSASIEFLHGQTEQRQEKSQQYIVVTQVGAYNFGIIVNRVFDTEEIVVKPVARILKDIEIFSGNTILGDGSVIMILDPAGIAKSSGEIEGVETQEEDEAVAERADGRRKTSLLLFSAGSDTPKAVPLELVSRLEEVAVKDIEVTNGNMVVQYRGKLMPLVPLNGAVEIGDEGNKPVLVFSNEDKSMGIIVDEIIDITEEHIDVEIESTMPDILGSAIISGKATDVIDVAHFLRQVSADWFKDHGDEPFDEETARSDTVSQAKRVLLVEDSPFFRNMLTPLLSAAGYDVTASESAVDALELCEQGQEFDVIVSDIEMPEMSGFEFAKHIKDNSNWQNTPLVALSSHATPQDMDRGIEAGFSSYIPKFDRDTLLVTLTEALFSGKQQQEDDLKEQGEAS